MQLVLPIVLTILLLAGLVLTGSLQRLEASDVGTVGAGFLRVEAGPRAMALAGAYTALSDDGFGMYWNPAGLSRLEQGVFSASHQQLFPDLNIDNDLLSWAYPLGAYHTVAISGRFLHSEDYYRTEWQDGSSFTNYSGSLGAHYAYGGSTGMAYGLGVKLIRERLAGYDANSFAVDGGVHYRSPHVPLRLGLVVQNLGPDIRFIEDGDPLPLTLRGGWAYDFYPLDWRLTLSSDLIYYQPENLSFIAFGMEYSLFDLLELRGGYRTSQDYDDDGQFFVGLGFNHSYFNLDYSYGDRENLDAQHSFGISFKFGRRPDPHEPLRRDLAIYRDLTEETELERELREFLSDD